MKRKITYLLVGMMLFVSGCGAGEETALDTENTELQVEILEVETETEDTSQILYFLDAFGESHSVEIQDSWEKMTYDLTGFSLVDGKMTYSENGEVKSKFGIDVSYHQGEIDWQQVKEAGVEFVILRVGYRGYGQEGKLVEDTKFQEYLKGAKAVGLDVGVYFFAQAINEEEALEEAEFVLSILGETELELPVVYDPESILDDESRTDDVTGEQFTANTIVFCNRIEEAGYEAAVYSNMMWEAYMLDLSQLSNWMIWYADYEALPQTPYDFQMWQYSESGEIPGIEGVVDLNVWISN